MSTTHYTVLSTDKGAYSVADCCHCHAHRTGRGSPLSPGPFSFITPRRRGGGGRWTSLHESTSVCPPVLHPFTGYTSTDFTIYITLHYPHTHKHKYSIFALSTQPHEHYLSALFALLSSWTSTLSQSMHTNIGPDLSCICIHPTPCEHVLPMCIVFFTVIYV